MSKLEHEETAKRQEKRVDFEAELKSEQQECDRLRRLVFSHDAEIARLKAEVETEIKAHQIAQDEINRLRTRLAEAERERDEIKERYKVNLGHTTRELKDRGDLIEMLNVERNRLLDEATQLRADRDAAEANGRKIAADIVVKYAEAHRDEDIYRYAAHLANLIIGVSEDQEIAKAGGPSAT